MQKVRREDLGEFVRSTLASRFAGAPQSKRATIIALSGDLGAGKTTFTQALAKELGVPGVVQSPTYVLMKSYPITFHSFTKLIHIDAYRLNDPQEFATLKPAEFLHDPHALVVIEWPERVEGMLPKPDLVLNFSSDLPNGEAGNIGDDSRYIEIV